MCVLFLLLLFLFFYEFIAHFIAFSRPAVAVTYVSLADHIRRSKLIAYNLVPHTFSSFLGSSKFCMST